MLVYFVRHGESEGNKNHMQQSSDSPLTTEGKLQAKAVAKRFANIDIDFIYSSTHKRASQTAEVISRKLKRPIEYWDDLVEVKQPSEIENKAMEDPEVARVKGLIAKNFYKGNWRYSNEENYEDLKKRSTRILEHLLEKHKNQNVLCVAHSGAIKFTVALVLLGENLTASGMWHFRNHSYQANTGVTIIEYTDKYGWALLSWNDTTHL